MRPSFSLLARAIAATTAAAPLRAQLTRRVSLSSTGAQSNGPSLGPGVIAASGLFVALTSNASNLVAGDTNNSADAFVHDRISGVTDIFVRDTQAGSTTRVSIATGGTQSSDSSALPALSHDGRYVAFSSDVFVHDRLTISTVRVSVDSNGLPGNAGSAVGVQGPAISLDGRVIAFSSSASNLVAGDTNGLADVFVHDLSSGATTRVSVNSAGVQGNGASYFPSASADGRFIVFSSSASNLVGSDTNGNHDVFLHDRVSGATSRVSVASSGAQAAGNSSPTLPPSISGDGRSIAFDRGAANLVSGDTNGSWDVFVHDRYGAPLVYCTSGTTAGGCAARIAASAQPDLAHLNACVNSISNVDGQRTGVVFYGLTASIQPWRPSGGSSFLCVKPPTQRSAPQSSGGALGQCDGTLLLDWSAFQSAAPGALGSPWTPGAVAFVQGWFRDPLSCRSTSLSDAVELTYQP